MKEDIERRRMEAAERMKSLSTSSVDGDETFSPFSPKTPTHKVKKKKHTLTLQTLQRGYFLIISHIYGSYIRNGCLCGMWF